MNFLKSFSSAVAIAAVFGGQAMAAQYDCKDHYNVLKKQAALDHFTPTKCLQWSTEKHEQGICKKWEYPWSVSPEVARKELLIGNERFMAGKALHSDQNAACVEEVAKNGQHPYAVIVACSDSRVGPEVVMDKGLGDVFVVRSAGHVVDAPAIGSIEYAVEHLGARLIVVVGHQKCGAVKATIDTPAGTSTGSLNIDSLVTAIRPAVDHAEHTCEGSTTPCDLLNEAIHENVEETIHRITHNSPIIEHELHSGKVKIIGGYYGLDGKLVLDPLPAH